MPHEKMYLRLERQLLTEASALPLRHEANSCDSVGIL